jgi:hypothetical protein
MHSPTLASQRPCTEESLFLKVDVGGETVRVFGRPEELAKRLHPNAQGRRVGDPGLEASGYDIRTNEIEAGMELHLPCLVKFGQGHYGHDDRETVNGYKTFEFFSSGFASTNPERPRSCPKA